MPTKAIRPSYIILRRSRITVASQTISISSTV
jgi:hypothetical protein